MRARTRSRLDLALETLESRLNPTAVTLGSAESYFPGLDSNGEAISNGLSAAVGDFNEDGHPDIALVTFTAGIQIFLNDGTGHMGAATSLGFGQGTIKIADINGDGHQDIVVSNGSFATSFSVALGNGDGTFQTPISFSTGEAVGSLTIANMNGDTKPDVVCSTTDGVVVLLNTGTAALLGPPVSYTPTQSPDGAGITTGDLNGDGSPDVIQAGFTSDEVLVYLNNGSGALGTPITISTPSGFNVASVAVADFDGNGKLDVAATIPSQNLVAVFQGNGNGTLQNYVGQTVPSASAITIGDFDLDGQPDIAVTEGFTLQLAVLHNNGAGGFDAPVVSSASIDPSDIAVADMDGDGRPDLVTSGHSSPAEVSITPDTTSLVASFGISAPTSTNVGVPFDITVTAKDANGATMTGYTGRVHCTSSDCIAGLPKDMQFTAADNGVKTFSVTLNTPSSQSVTVADAVQTSITKSASVTVVNHNPTANDDPLTVAENSSATTVNVLGNDSSAPDAGETLSVTSVTQPSHGTVTLTAGVVQYAPAAGYSGPDNFTYTISDGNGGTATANVKVTVTGPPLPPQNTPPTISDIADRSIPEGGTTGTIGFTVSDAETLAANLTLTDGSSNTTLVPTADIVLGGSGRSRTITVTPAAGEFGSAVITITVTDGGGKTASDTFTLTVTSPPPPGSPPPPPPPPPPPSGTALAAVADDKGNLVVFDSNTQTKLLEFRPFDTATSKYVGQMSVALGDVDGDGVNDLIVATRGKRAGKVKVFDGADIIAGTVTGPQDVAFVGYPLSPDGTAARNGYKQGLTVSSADVNGDTIPDIVVASRTSTSTISNLVLPATVKVYAGHSGGVISTALGSFQPIGTSTDGMYVTAGDTNGDGKAEVAISSANQSLVKIFQFSGGVFTQMGNDLSPFAGAAFVPSDGDGQINAVNVDGSANVDFEVGHLNTNTGAVDLELLNGTGGTVASYPEGSGATFFSLDAIDPQQNLNGEIMLGQVTPTAGRSIELLDPTTGT